MGIDVKQERGLILKLSWLIEFFFFFLNHKSKAKVLLLKRLKNRRTSFFMCPEKRSESNPRQSVSVRRIHFGPNQRFMTPSSALLRIMGLIKGHVSLNFISIRGKLCLFSSEEKLLSGMFSDNSVIGNLDFLLILEEKQQL